MLALLLPIGVFAQGGLFQRGNADNADNNSGLLREGQATVALNNEIFGAPTGTDDITNQTFNAPLGSGVLFLLATSAGYATIKSRKRNRKSKETTK